MFAKINSYLCVMAKRIYLIIPVLLLAVSACKVADEPQIIPQPVSIVMLEKGGAAPAAPVPDNPEGYVLTVQDGQARVESAGDAGRFYAGQTLAQLKYQYGRRIPDLQIVDYPRFSYRGQHLDVSRHFFSKECVKKQLRMMASLKLNRLHWHLTDGVAWRLQIDAYPELTEGVEHYTREDVAEILQLADSLHITIIPEIEMFGHSEEVLEVLPGLMCDGASSSSELCIGNPATFEFLETVLSEVMELFPSETIHIGGDEANKEIWSGCSHCRVLMKKEGLKSADELQSWGMKKIESFINSRGRRMMGWDEIMDGGVAESAIVMSWRGEQAGWEAAAMGHDVVMTPSAYNYFDHFQDNPDKEPAGMGGFLPLEKVYGYDPAPEGLEGREHIIGCQACLWTELVETESHLEHMLYPRMFASAENAWTPQELKNYDNFRSRALKLLEKAGKEGYSHFDLAHEYGHREGYNDTLRHKAHGCSVTYETPYDTVKYAAGGDCALTDGLQGSWTYTTRWQGFDKSDVCITVDLGRTEPISEVSATFGQWGSAWVWLPADVTFEVSQDGSSFTTLATIGHDIAHDEVKAKFQTFKWEGSAEARYIKMRGRISEEGSQGWLFTDEIIVN